MKPIKILGFIVLALALFTETIEIGPSSNPIAVSLVSKAEAVVGRPLTPMSYAGVARRTVRRCRAGVYRC